MGGLARGGDVVERRAFVEERRLRRVEIFGGDLLIERAAAEGDDPAAPIADRKYHAIAKAIVRHRNILAGDDKSGFRHVLDRNFERAEMLLERVLLRERIAEAEFKLRRGMDAAVEQITAAARPVARSQRRLEVFGGELDDVVQRLAPFFIRRRFPRHHRQRHAGLSRKPLDGLWEAHALGEHEKIENVAVLARGKVEPHRLLVIDEERRRLLFVERRQPFPFTPRLTQFHAPADDFRNRKPGAQFVEKLRGKAHGDSPG